MSSNKKTIQINPDLFKVQGSSKSRTRSNREKKKVEKPITPNLLKKQLIERIKDHKKRLEQSEQPSRSKNVVVHEKKTDESKDDDDEFIMSMNYLSSLSEKESEKQPKFQTTLQSQTVPIFHKAPAPTPKPSSTAPSVQMVDIGLHDDLKNTQFQLEPIEMIIPMATTMTTMDEDEDIDISQYQQQQQPQQSQDIVLKYERPTDVPYGCLKNGSKPTYRSWMTQKNDIYKQQQPKDNSSVLLEREKKLNELKSRFKENDSEELKQIEKEEDSPVYIKKTIRRKYTLGKSKMYRKVGVLIKNIQTRKKVIDSHKELKSHHVNDIKKYLRNKGLIKIGNHTPTDLLRKLYESAILTGDVNNSNKETVLHNLLNDQNSHNHFQFS